MARERQTNRTMTAWEWAMLVTLSLVWGASFFFNGVAVAEMPTLTVVVCRVTLAALILWAVMGLLGQAMPMSPRIWAAFFGMGLLNNVLPFTLIVWGQSHIASGLASILNATTPMFTVIVAHLATGDEKMTGPRILGVVLGIVGVAVMIGGDFVSSVGDSIPAQLACLAAAFSYALAGVFGRRFAAEGVPPMATAAGQVTASSVLLLPVMLIVDQPWALPTPSLSAIGSLLGLSSLSTAFAYILYFRILATAGATNLLLVTLLVPVSAILLGVLILGEVLLPKHMLGMAAIALGLAAIDGRPLNLFRKLPYAAR